MKVTVCFGNVRVVVPCGSGDLLVADLIEKAVLRYKKAIGKSEDYWVTVHNLKSLNDGGILDADDQLNDVADDREQIIAIYEEQGGPPLPHNGGDGTSASSVGTSSPELFQGSNGDLVTDKDGYVVHLREGNKNDVVITPSDLQSGSTLIVRRGSEPALTSVGKSAANHDLDFQPFKATKRWSAIASIDEAKSPRASVNSDEEYHHGFRNDDIEEEPPPPLTRTGGSGQESSNGIRGSFNKEARGSFNRFARDSARQSLANNPVMYKWLEAQERQQELYEDTVHNRKEPLGGSGLAEVDEESKRDSQLSTRTDDSLPSVSSPDCRRDLGELVVMKNSGGPLGIHVVPDFDGNGRDMGLMIQGIEAGGRIYRDGRLKVNDRIIEINGTSLMDVDFTKAQEVFKQALQGENLELLIIKSEAPPLPKLPPPLLPGLKTAVPKSDASLASPAKPDPSKEPAGVDMVSAQLLANGEASSKLMPTVETVPDGQVKLVSPTKKTPPPPPVRNPNTVLSSQPKNRIVAPTNTRRIGKKIHIKLTKGAAGLGFSITTRDNPAGGPAPIYIKNIMPKGAAIEDGRLKPGDRLLEVNEQEMTGKLQSQVVNMLRSVKSGESVTLVVSRQVNEEDKTSVVPRELQQQQPQQEGPELKAPSVLPPQPPERAGDDDNVTASQNKEILKMNIALNETGSAGLGVSVKGKTVAVAQGMQDLGIFIKSIITGGAASKDGRLRVNDQLVEVNNQTLADKTNSQAMELLREAMHRDGPSPGFIHLVVARHMPKPSLSILPDEPHELRVSRSEPPPGVDYIAGALDLEKLGQGLDLDDASSTDVSTPPESKNPVLEKMMNLRNLSYQKATHESMMNTTEDDVFMSKNIQPRAGMSSPLTHGHQKETAVVETDEDQANMRSGQGGAKVRPASTLGFLRPEPPHTVSSAKSDENLDDSSAPKPPDWLVEWDKDREDTSTMSPTEIESLQAFEREGFGRQSMSEKRKGHMDPRISDFYQKMKLTKDKGLEDNYYSATWDPRKFKSLSALSGKGENSHDSAAEPLKRVGSAESLMSQSNNHSTAVHDKHQSSKDVIVYRVTSCPHCLKEILNGLPSYEQPPSYDEISGNTRTTQYGPSLGLKKSSSLESLQTAVQEASMDEEGNYFKAPNRGMVRGRGCNESFRAAVDRSYDEQGQSMPTVDEEDSEAGSFSQGPHSQGSSFSGQDMPSQPTAEDGREFRKEGSRKKSKKDREKDKGGLFKGLGNMFRFGKHRRSEEKPPAPPPPQRQQQPQLAEKSSSLTMKDSESGKHSTDEMDPIKARQIEHQRVQEHYHQLHEKQRLYDQQQQLLQQQRVHQEVTTAPRSVSPPPVGMTRAERIQQLRSEHQRRHKERQGQYPMDAREEQYERQLQEMERQRLLDPRSSGHRLPPPQHVQEPYHRPPSRIGQADPSQQYGHYQNLREIQDQLSRHDYYQHQYQRQLPHQQMAARQAQRYPSDTNIHDTRRHYPQDPYARGYAIPDPHHDTRHDPRYDPRHDRRHDPHDPRHYPHSYSHTGLPQSGPAHRSQTPISQVGYVSYHSRPPQSALTAHYAAVPPQNADPYNSHSRHYSEQTAEHPRSIYSHDPNYGSLPRRPREIPRDHTGLVSNAAKV